MADPLNYIVAAKDKPTTPVTPIDMNELGGWAQETEPQKGQGIVTADGKWAVNMMSLQSANAAGYATDVQQTEISGKT